MKFTPGQPPVDQQAALDAAPVGSIGQKPGPAPAQPLSLRDAAASGNPAAQFELATRYADGRTVARDPRIAMQWFEKAALQNFAPAQYRLGSHFERGLGVERDTKKAASWYLRAAEAGNIRAMHNLAVLSAEGVDGKPDYAAAASWFRKAAEHGVRDSQYNLGILYARGLGIEQNMQQSWVWFSLAANQGDVDAGKKRDDVAARLDGKALTSAKIILDSFRPRAPEAASNDVAAPAGGWDQPARADTKPATQPAPAPAPSSSTRPAPKGKITSL